MSADAPVTPPTAQKNKPPVNEEKNMLEAVIAQLRTVNKDILPQITDQEAAALIVSLYDSKGAKAVESLMERALQPNGKGKLLGYEKRLLQKHMLTQTDKLVGLDRRKFLHRLGELGAAAGVITLGINDISRQIPDETKEKMVEKISPSIANGMAETRQKDRKDQVRDLTGYVKQNMPTDATTVGDSDKFYAEVDRRIAQINKEPPQKLPHMSIFNRIIPYVAMGMGVYSFHIRAQRAGEEKDQTLSAAAGYVARKVSTLIEQEKQKAIEGPSPA